MFELNDLTPENHPLYSIVYLMFRRIRNRFKKSTSSTVSFDEVLVDALNIPLVDLDRLEGRREMPISPWRLYVLGGVFALIACVFGYELFQIQIVNGASFYERSITNSLESEVIIAQRGVILDRYGEPLAWNEVADATSTEWALRAYTPRRGIGSVIGYVNAPRKDEKGHYYRTDYTGRAGIEESENALLAGTNGKRFVEVDVRGDSISQHTTEPPVAGTSVTLSIDAELSEVIHDIIASTTAATGFRSGAAAIMDVETGELIALSTFPSYDPKIFADGTDRAAIVKLNNDPRAPLVDKIIAGTYIPGSIVKPFVAYAALAENVINPEKEIFSNGRLEVANKYDPDKPAIFRDWKAHGYTDMRRAIAVSGDVYFYTIGGGTPDQQGLGITKLHDWMTRFGFGTTTGIDVAGERGGVVPNPTWKQEVFNDDWRLGDTYLTAIGQFGWQVTPLQMLRAYATIANGGKVVTPTLIHGANTQVVDLHLNQNHLALVREGMRMAVDTDGGTVRGLDRKDVAIAGKSGTAELDRAKTKVNTWVTGFFPYEHPRYSFILFMENGPYANQVGAGRVMKGVFDWIVTHRPQYISGVSTTTAAQ